MQENSRQLVLAALTHCRGNRMKAATLLELSRAQFYKLVKMHGLFQTEKNAIGCRELQARGKCSKEDASNCEQMGNAGKKPRPITSKKEMLKGGPSQL